MPAFRALALVLAASLGACPAIAQELPRRGSLGVGLAITPDGITVQQPQSDAAEQVFEAGDVLIAINGQPTGDWTELQAALHQLPSGEPVSVIVRRAGIDVSFEVASVPTPQAAIEGARVIYGSAATPSGLRVRTVTMIPESDALAGPNGRPAVFFIQGITCQSIDLIGGPDHPRGNLFRRLLDAGFIVAFADKPGTGDSDGDVCLRGGFDVEVDAYTAAARALSMRADVDSSRLYSVGVSMGGIQAPLVAREVDFAGIVTWGTGVQPWADYIVTNFRMRMLINPAQSIIETEPALFDMREVVTRALVLEQGPEEIAAASPETYQRFVASFGSIDGFAGRALRFHQEIDRAPIAAAWEAYEGALLSLHGEYDWVASIDDHRMAGILVVIDGEGSAEFEVLSGVDHGWTAHDSLEASFASAFAGRPDRQFHSRVVEWLTARAGL